MASELAIIPRGVTGQLALDATQAAQMVLSEDLLLVAEDNERMRLAAAKRVAEREKTLANEAIARRAADLVEWLEETAEADFETRREALSLGVGACVDVGQLAFSCERIEMVECFPDAKARRASSRRRRAREEGPPVAGQLHLSYSCAAGATVQSLLDPRGQPIHWSCSFAILVRASAEQAAAHAKLVAAEAEARERLAEVERTLKYIQAAVLGLPAERRRSEARMARLRLSRYESAEQILRVLARGYQGLPEEEPAVDEAAE
jgi:hypothetical protein